MDDVGLNQKQRNELMDELWRDTRNEIEDVGLLQNAPNKPKQPLLDNIPAVDKPVKEGVIVVWRELDHKKITTVGSLQAVLMVFENFIERLKRLIQKILNIWTNIFNKNCGELNSDGLN